MPWMEGRICSTNSIAIFDPFYRCIFPGMLETGAQCLWNGNARNFVVQECGVAAVHQRQDTCQKWRERPNLLRHSFQEGYGRRGVENWLSDYKVRAGAQLAVQVFYFLARVRRIEVQCAANKECSRLANIGAGMVNAGIELLFDQFNQPGWYNVVIVHCIG